MSRFNGATKFFAIAAVALWGIAIASIWVRVGYAAIGDDRAMAVFASMAALLFGRGDGARDRDKDALVTAIEDLSRRRARRAASSLRKIG